MARRYKSDLTDADVTPKARFLSRRQIIAGAIGAGAIGTGVVRAFSASTTVTPQKAKLSVIASRYSTDEPTTRVKDIKNYNNFYEFGTGKGDPAAYASALETQPWSVKIDGLVEQPGTYDLSGLTKGIPIEERIYRHRCVEGWSMVVPWNGFPLSTLLGRVGVQPGAKYVSFETLLRPSQMRGQSSPFIDWPYREGLRLDEAMHPLTILATGIYGEALPNQCGAPIRLVVPWKYGFKGIKSIVRISLTATRPKTTWNMIAPNEYGFYSNVNPKVNHPRWSQASERKIGTGFFAKRQPTLMFNGYQDQVAGLYANMDLRANF